MAPENSHARQVVAVLLCAAAAIVYIGRSCMGPATDAIRQDLDISELEMGWAMSVFFWSYAIGQVPCGWLASRFGTRKALAGFAILWSLATAGIGLSLGLWALIGVQFLFGLSQAGIFPASSLAIKQWIPVSRRALVSGSLASFMQVGAIIALLTAAWFINAASWRWLYLAVAMPGVLWAIVFFWWFRDRPEDHPGVSQDELKQIRAESEVVKNTNPQLPWLVLLSSFDLWAVCGQQFFRAAGYAFYITWFQKYLKETHDITMVKSTLLSALPLAASGIGAAIGGQTTDWIFRRTGSRRLSRQGVAVASMLMGAAFIFYAYFAAGVAEAITVIAAGAFFAGLGGPCAYTVTIDKGGEHVAPVFGVMNMSGNIGAAVSPPVVAWFVSMTGNNWTFVLLLFVGIYVGAAICWAVLNPNGTFFDRPAAAAG